MPDPKIYHTPASLGTPFAHYSHGVEVPPGLRWLYASGQLGLDEAGTIPDDVEAQAHLCFEKIRDLLAAAKMTMGDIVRINAYVTDRSFFEGYMRARDAHVATPPPASTLMIVGGFTRPEFKVEVEVIAAAP